MADSKTETFCFMSMGDVKYPKHFTLNIEHTYHSPEDLLDAFRAHAKLWVEQEEHRRDVEQHVGSWNWLDLYDMGVLRDTPGVISIEDIHQYSFDVDFDEEVLPDQDEDDPTVNGTHYAIMSDDDG